MTLFEAYKKAKSAFGDCFIEDREFEAKQLLYFAFDIDASKYSTIKCEPCNSTRLAYFEELCKKRLSGYPLQYIIGKWPFYKEEYIVNSGCLIPRPETEIIVESALALNIKNCHFADLCCGSGCIGISFAKNNIDASGIFLDVSDEALEITRRNIDYNNVDKSKISVKKYDLLCDEFPSGVNLLMSNPPYITGKDMNKLSKELSYEPQIALYGGEDGLVFYRAIASRVVPRLENGAYVVLEIGYDQKESVTKLMTDANCDILDVKKDFNNIFRTVIARKKK